MPTENGVVKKKVTSKRKRRTSEAVKIEALEGSVTGINKRLDKMLELMVTSKGDVVTSDLPPSADPNKPLKETPQGEVVFKKGPNGEKLYKFWSLHTELKQKLKDSYKTDINQVTGEYVIVPPVVANFGIETDGPPGYWMTTDEKLMQLMREKISKKKRLEVIEVTDDPLYAHI